MDLVDLFGAGRLATGLLGLGAGLTLGERGGLSLAGTEGLVELAAKALILGLEVVDTSLKGLAASTRDGLHTFIIGKTRAAAALPWPRRRDQLELHALNRYDLLCRKPRIRWRPAGL